MQLTGLVLRNGEDNDQERLRVDLTNLGLSPEAIDATLQPLSTFIGLLGDNQEVVIALSTERVPPSFTTRDVVWKELDPKLFDIGDALKQHLCVLLRPQR